jgi:UDP-N-acetylmuramate--alanine ligase
MTSPLPGQHNVCNALAAVAVGRAVGLDFESIASSLAGFGGVHRRFERKGTFHGAAVVDDYAHHPTEVAATLAAARQAFPGGRVVAVFQPHLFSRTRDHADDFGRALLAADVAIVTSIYPSREAPIEGVTADLVVNAARRSGHRRVELCDHWAEDGVGVLAKTAESGGLGPGDVVLTLGAGDIYRLGERLTHEAAGTVTASVHLSDLSKEGAS